MASQTKARRYARVALPKQSMVAWEHEGKKTISSVGVLALGGLFISTPDPPAAGESIELVFKIPNGRVHALAVVRDSQPGKGMGIEFTAMEPAALERLQRLMNILTRV